MTPGPGERLQRFVGDILRFRLAMPGGVPPPEDWRARLRTNLGRARILRQEILEAHTDALPNAGAAWRDIPMKADREGWWIDLPLGEVGYFDAKAFLIDAKGWQVWPEGPDVGISVHPNACRTANTIYCAFPRLFGKSKPALTTKNDAVEKQIRQVEDYGYAIIPPSGKLRDLIQQLPHIVHGLGCRIVHLLPVNPTPTTYARFGRFGSPYAALDFTEIDPDLVVFDKRTTGVDQFCELTYATHLHGGRVFLDIVINHTGWGSILQENHPEWFLRNADGTFASPGAWGTTWEDLVELKHDNVALWDRLSDMFLTWCRRGVDGFRCDAGYKVPVPAWQFIITRVRQEFPDTVFLLEGLGGSWEATEALLTCGGMQWAYSELFQNYSGIQVAGYLDHSFRQSGRVGLLVHYSETHDNPRLAAGGPPEIEATPSPEKRRAWSLLRNRLCALASVSGGFGFTCGVEWLAVEKINVHAVSGLGWGNKDNIVPELANLNRLLSEHPCFFDGARATRLSAADSSVYALLRESAEGKDAVLVLVNTDLEREREFTLTPKSAPGKPGATSTQPAIESLARSEMLHELLGQPPPPSRPETGGDRTLRLAAGAVFCLSICPAPIGLSGEAYRAARAQAAWAIQALTEDLSVREIGSHDWRVLAQFVERSPLEFLAAIHRLDAELAASNLEAALTKAIAERGFSPVVRWSLVDRGRVTPVPPGHWMLVEDNAPFRATLARSGNLSRNVQSIPVRGGHVACFAPEPPLVSSMDFILSLERYAEIDQRVDATVRFLAAAPAVRDMVVRAPPDSLVLLTNGIGGMARMCVDLGRVRSKYDCVLAANLNSSAPVDRHVFAKRIRVWVNADGFISPLDLANLAGFRAGPPAVWSFVANAGDARTVEIEARAEMADGSNTTMIHFRRVAESTPGSAVLPVEADVRLTVRVDIEDRNFHWETKRNSGAEHHFSTRTRVFEKTEVATPEPRSAGSQSYHAGFEFAPAPDRQLRVFSSSGEFHPQPEWSEGIPHPVEQSRGQTGSGDAYSPGWFELPLPKGGSVTVVITAETGEIHFGRLQLESETGRDGFGSLLRRAVHAFVVRRDSGKTVIAGYPWFLDWGRDTFICARGLLAAGMATEVEQILATFARFERDGTLPNTLHGDDASNRDTSDAPLWFAVACEEAGIQNSRFKTQDAALETAENSRTIRDVLRSIASNYIRGTPNGIRMDPDSGLIWSPAHFTWMDTNFPAGTPREGYPVEIQALWIRLLRQLGRIDRVEDRSRWSELADRALASVEKLFWLEDRGWYADVLLAGARQPARGATASDALRSNCLFLVSLGLVRGDRARRCLENAQRFLLVPGAVRSLAPLPVSVPLPVYGNDGRQLNDPRNPYWPRYEGDEDTRRKPAYHSGTAWTWTLPVFCEALALAWDFAPEAVAAARAYLGSLDKIMSEGCLGQIPELLDGDAPHAQRGCDAQAWSVTEALRVWKWLNVSAHPSGESTAGKSG